MTAIFAYRQQVVDALREVTKDEVIAAWEEMLGRGQLTVALFAKGSEIKALPETIVVKDLQKLKSMPVY